MLGEQQRVQIMERIQLARQFLLTESAIEKLMRWKIPQECMS